MKTGIVQFKINELKKASSDMDLGGFSTEQEFFVDDMYNDRTTYPNGGIEKGTLVTIKPDGMSGGYPDATLIVAQPTEAMKPFSIMMIASKPPYVAGYPVNLTTGAMENFTTRYPRGRFEHRPTPILQNGVYYVQGITATGEVDPMPFTTLDLYKRVYAGPNGTIVPYPPTGAGEIPIVVGRIVGINEHSKIEMIFPKYFEIDVVEV